MEPVQPAAAPQEPSDAQVAADETAPAVSPTPVADPREAATNLRVLAGLSAAAFTLVDVAFFALAHSRPVVILAGLLGLCYFGFVIGIWAWRSIWLRRCWTNAALLDPTALRDGSGFAVGSWFIPVINLWWPRRVLLDLRRANGFTDPRIVNVWWVSGLLVFLLGLMERFFGLRAPWVVVLLCALLILRAVLFIRMVTEVTDHQAQALNLAPIRRPGDPVLQPAD